MPRQGSFRIDDAKITVTPPKGWHYVTDTDMPTTKVHSNLPGTCKEKRQRAVLLPPDFGATKRNWYAEIEYHPIGYVDMGDAISADFDWMLRDMQDVYRRWNVERENRGELPVNIIGWTIRPGYNPDQHSMIWSVGKEYDPSPVNYNVVNIIKLGRNGYVKVVLYITTSQLGEALQLGKEIDSSIVYDRDARVDKFNIETDKDTGLTIGQIVSDDLRVDYPQNIGSAGHWMQGLEQVTKKILYFLFETMFFGIAMIVLFTLQFFRGRFLDTFREWRYRQRTIEVNPPPRRI